MGAYADRLKAKQAQAANDAKYMNSTEVGQAIAAAIGEGGAIEKWADGRYAAKVAEQSGSGGDNGGGGGGDNGLLNEG